MKNIVEKFEISILGRLKIKYGDKCVGTDTSKAKSKKIWILFEYLIVNRNRKVSQEELIDVLWPNTNVQNPANSLKVLAFKLRNEIDSLGFIKGKELIQSSGGSYQFSQDVPWVVDAFEFEKAVEEAAALEKKLKSTDKVNDGSVDEADALRIKLLESAFNMYKGNAISEAQAEPWAASVQTRYRDMYVSLVNDLVAYYEEHNESKKIVDLCRDAILQQPYEEGFYYHIIRVYAASENYSAAKEMYMRVKQMMHDEYGALTDRRFEDTYKRLMRGKARKNLTVGEFASHFDEHTNFLNSFLVEYGEFMQIYRFIARKLERIEHDAFFCLYTLGKKKGAQSNKKKRDRNIQILGDALSFMLRQGDVVSLLSENQYGVIFSDILEKNVASIDQRIRNYFEKNKKDDEYGIICSHKKIEASAFDVSIKKQQA